MSQTINKAIGEGFPKGELYAALAYDETDKFGGMKIKGICFDVTSASTGSSVIKPIDLTLTMTGTGGLAQSFKSLLDVDARLGSYANAIYGIIDFTGGSITGLGSAICAEMLMGAAMTAAGTYGVLELELGIPASWTAVQSLSLIYAQVYGGDGTALGLFNHSAYLLNVVGLGAADTGHIFHTIATPTGTHGLRILIDGVGYDILLKATGA